MALVLANRVQEAGTANTTVSFTLTGAIQGFQSFAAVGNGNTTYYSAFDGAGNWEVGLGTYLTSGPTLTRTTIYASSNAGSAVTFAGTVSVFLTYPSGKSVNLDASGNVSALGTVASGTWQGSTVGVAYGGTGVTASSGPNSVVLRDSDGNISGVNNVEVGLTLTTSSGGVTTLTAASTQIQILTGSANHTFRLPDATSLHAGVFYTLANGSSGTLTVTDYAGTVIETIAQGGAAQALCISPATIAGTWGFRVFASSNTTWGNAFLDYPGAITSATWQGNTVQPAYGGTGLTTFVGANNALYSTGTSTLTAGTLPVAAGGTGNTSGQAASVANALTFNNGGSGDASGTAFDGSAARTISYNTVGAPSATGGGASGTWNISISGTAATATTATTANALNVANSYTGTAFTASTASDGYFYANRGNVAYQAGIQFRTAGTTNWYNFLDNNVNTLTWYQTNTSTSVMTLTQAGVLNVTGNITLAGSQVLTASNYNSYSPTLTGGGASGTWGISIAGNAATATTATNQSGGTINATTGTITPNTSGVSTGFNVVNGDITTYRSGGTTGVIYFGTSGTKYLFWDGSNYQMPGGELYVNSNLTLTAGNYNSYSPTLTGGGASGTWSINITGSAGSAGSVDYNNLTNKTGGTGTYTTSGDYRAPIFYDSNNTAYFLNPAGVSSLYNLTVGTGLQTQAYPGVVISGSNDYDYLFTNGTWSSSVTAGWLANCYDAWEMAIHDSGTRVVSAFAFFGGANNYILMGRDIGWGTTYIQAENSFRAPVFYDSNDTNYYVDPVSTSYLNYLNVGYAGVSTLRPSGGYDAPNFNTLTPNYLYYGYLAGGSNLPTNYSYPYGTFMNLYPGGAGGAQIYISHSGNDFCFRGSWGGAGFSTWNRILTDQIYSSYSNFGANAVYGGVFYDGNDTGYYLDPNSTSDTALRIRGGALHGPNPTWGAYLSVGANGWVGGSYASVVTTNGNLHLDAASGAQTYINHYAGTDTYIRYAGNDRLSVFGPSNYTQATGSLRAPIFYDSDNTGYYVNPNGTSYVNTIQGAQYSVGNANPADAVNGSPWYGLGASNVTGWTSGATMTQLAGYYGLRLRSSGAFLDIQGSSGIPFFFNDYGQFIGSARAPIFYDSNDTNYYVDPASSSYIYTLTTQYDSTISGVKVGRGGAATSPNSNTAVGLNANSAVTTSARNTAVGYSANAAMVTRTGVDLEYEGNTAVGYLALASNTGNSTGIYSSTAVGAGALRSSTTGYYNTALGAGALYSATTAAANVAVGASAGLNVTSANNVFIGQDAGSAMTTTSSNVIIGRYTGSSATLDITATASNIVLASGTGAVRFHINSSNGFFTPAPGGATLYPTFFARAWVNFNGTGTVAIRASGNVTSITDNGVGDYTVNFTTAMPDANYATVASGNVSGGTAWVAAPYAGTTPTTTAVRIRTVDAGAAADLSYVNVAILR